MKDGEKGGIKMLDRTGNERNLKKGEPEHENVVRITCPVCGKPLGKENLPSIESVILDKIYYHNGIRFVNSKLFMELEFSHYIDEELGVPLEDPHEVQVVVRAEFDSKGTCTTFDIIELRAVP
jgi:hypothetical protein